MFYELWDVESRNLVGSFKSEDEALALVVSFGRTGGQTTVDHFLLGWCTEDGDGGEIATGQELLALAESKTAPFAT